MFEVVYTVTDWNDGPRRGIADYLGKPHLFESDWRGGEDLDAHMFLLMPIDQETLTLALEDWDIWRRWEAAFHQGKTTQEIHPALPEDRSRHEELERLLKGRLVLDPAQAMRRNAEFRVRNDPNWNGHGIHPLECQWTDPLHPSHE